MKSNLKDITRLIDVYGPLLTDTKYHYVVQYYFEDYSLHEIAEQYHVSRAAVHSSIMSALEELMAYEKKLHGLARQEQRLQLYEGITDSALKEQLIALERTPTQHYDNNPSQSHQVKK